ncbi:glycosyltransferase family 2 protein [Rothia sp. P13129]|uniref:glycosyltransferase family 2 protein n=1 Tax=Rothia sp. P13129 TaxID=3402664 RepID=UPI003ACBB0EF
MKKILSTLRTELGQISYSFKQRNSKDKIKAQYKAIKGMQLHSTLPPRTLKREELWAVSVVKNEIDVLPLVIDHFLAQGIDKLLIADNLSSDGTWEYLQEKAANDPRILISRDTVIEHTQSEKMTWLSHIAWQRGARWIIPFDADEFWYAPSTTLKSFLKNTDSSVIYARFHHTVPVIDSPQDLKNTELIMDTANSFPGKVAFKTHPLAIIWPGNHNVARLGKQSCDLDIIHVQYRGVQQIARKVRQGTESSKLTGEDLSWFAPHWEAGSKLSDEQIQQVWENISSGKPDERIKFAAEGPMKRSKFLQWTSWNQQKLDSIRPLN